MVQVAAAPSSPVEIPLVELRVCTNTTCSAQGSAGLLADLREYLRSEGLRDIVRLVPCGCLGGCSYGPNMTVRPGYRVFFAMDLEKTKRLLLFLGLTRRNGGHT